MRILFVSIAITKIKVTLASCQANLQKTDVKIFMPPSDVCGSVTIKGITACHTVIVYHPKSKRYWYMHISPLALRTRNDLKDMNYSALSPQLYGNNKVLKEFCAINEEHEEVDILVIDTNSSSTPCPVEELKQQIP